MSTCDWILLLLGTSSLLYMFFRTESGNEFDPLPRYNDRQDGDIVLTIVVIMVTAFSATVSAVRLMEVI